MVTYERWSSGSTAVVSRLGVQLKKNSDYRLPKTTSGNLESWTMRKYMDMLDIYGYKWICMDIYGYIWIYISASSETHPTCCTGLDIHLGYPYISMHIHSYPSNIFRDIHTLYPKIISLHYPCCYPSWCPFISIFHFAYPCVFKGDHHLKYTYTHRISMN